MSVFLISLRKPTGFLGRSKFRYVRTGGNATDKKSAFPFSASLESRKSAERFVASAPTSTRQTKRFFVLGRWKRCPLDRSRWLVQSKVCEKDKKAPPSLSAFPGIRLYTINISQLSTTKRHHNGAG